MLREKIQFQIEELEKQINESSHNISGKLLLELESFANSVLRDLSYLGSYNADEYVETVYMDNDKIDYEEYKKKLQDLKMLAKGKQQMPNNTLFDFTAEEIKFIKTFCMDTKAFVRMIREEKKANKDIDVKKELSSKIDKEELLTLSDFEMIIDMISKFDISTQKEILKDFINHNINASQIEKNQVESEVEKTQKVKKENKSEEKVLNPVSIEEIEVVLKKHIPRNDDVKVLLNTIKEYEEETTLNINLNNLDQVLDFLISNNLLNSFKGQDKLLTILIYGRLEDIKQAYTEFKEKGLLNKDFIYEYPSLWLNQDEEKRLPRIKKSGGPNTNVPLQYKAAVIYRKELYTLIDYYRENGLDFEKDSKRCAIAFSSSIDKVKQNMETYKKYGIVPNASSFGYCNVTEKCDRLIECGILDPSTTITASTLKDSSIKERRMAYTNFSPAIINDMQEAHVVLLEALINEKGSEGFDEFIKLIFGNMLHDKATLKGEFKTNLLGHLELKNSSEEVKMFAQENGLTNILYELNKEKYESMVNAADEYGKINNSESTLNSQFIKYLDTKYAVDDKDYLYEIEGVRISRYKVLRIYEALKEYNDNNPDKQFTEEDIKLFAITYGTYIPVEVYDKIKKETQNQSKGGRKQ